jgi:hypothetical protein
MQLIASNAVTSALQRLPDRFAGPFLVKRRQSLCFYGRVVVRSAGCVMAALEGLRPEELSPSSNTHWRLAGADTSSTHFLAHRLLTSDSPRIDKQSHELAV